MLKERRNSPRYNFNRYARIQVEGSGPSRDCLIVDMSEGGVRLHSEIIDMPNDFMLLIADAEHPRGSCAWCGGSASSSEPSSRISIDCRCVGTPYPDSLI